MPIIILGGNSIMQAIQQIDRKLDALSTAVIKTGALLMAKIDELEAEVAKVASVEDSAIALINGISQQLKDLQAASNDARLQAVIDSLDAKAGALAAAVSANTPAATPAPAPAPAPTPAP